MASASLLLIGPGRPSTYSPCRTQECQERLHLDLRADGYSTIEELQRLLDLGARRVDVGQAADVSWVVLADPDSAEAQSILIEREFVSRRTVRLCTDTTPTSLQVPGISRSLSLI
jgi:hypothetical protein